MPNVTATPPAAPEPPPRGRRRPLLATGLLVAVVAVVGIGIAAAAGGGQQGPAPDAAATVVALASPSGVRPATPGGSAGPTDPGASSTPAPGLGSPVPASVPPSSVGTSPSPPAPGPEASGPPGGGAGHVPRASLQARLDRVRERLSIPGVSVAILWDDGRQWLGASGWRDVKAGDPMTTDTAFALASVSKTFTAAVVLELAGEGMISLDDRVARWLPQYPVHPKLTIRQLLDHTSGIPDYFLNGKIDRPLQADKTATWTPEETWAYVPPLRKRFLPGRVWLYSNSNYLLLGELVQAVTGRSLALEIRDRLLDPLGLTAAWYQAVERPRADGTRGYRLVADGAGGLRPVSVAKRSAVMPFRSVVTAAAGAGSMAATALDAARWMQAFAGGDVLAPSMQHAMLADVAVTRRLGAEIPYGLGIQAVPLAGRRALGHSGRFLGFRNVVRYLPAEGVTIAVLSNQGVQDPARVAEALLKVILPPLPRPTSSPGSPTATP